MSAQDFEVFVRSLGIRPRNGIAADGRWRRCPTENHPGKRNGAYKLSADGSIGWAQDWATMTEAATWRPDRAPSLPPVDTAALARRSQQERAERDAAIQGAREYYGAASPLLGGHPYLTAHGLDMTGCRGLKIDARGWLVVPMVRAGRLLSLQRIHESGEKRFWPGAPTTATQYELDRRGATLTILCEGLATGLALLAAVPTSRVVVAFTAGNLVRVAEQLPRRGLTCVAADNDHGTAARIGKNPGVEAATAAAAIIGCGVAVPDGIRGTDYCDLRAERYADRLEKRIRGSHVTDAQLRRQVDAEIERAVMRSAVFVAVAG
jgi:putative DNA primase/helicase